MWVLATGAWPVAQLDHKDGQKAHNRLDNFREASHAQNLHNIAVHRDNVTGAKGVSRKRDKFEARIRANGRSYRLGVFRTVAEASAAYRTAAKELHGEFARFEK
jgi:hypothetical protein